MKLSATAFSMLIAFLAGCAASPPPHVYALNGPATASRSADPGGEASLELERVLVPDYLDTTDILIRVSTHEVHASRTGRWAERLSLGITDALRDRLGDAQAGIPSRIRVTVAAFDVWRDGRCVLSATWEVIGNASRDLWAAGRATISIEPVNAGQAGDDAIVAGVAEAVRQLSGDIASSIRTHAAGVSASNRH